MPNSGLFSRVKPLPLVGAGVAALVVLGVGITWAVTSLSSANGSATDGPPTAHAGSMPAATSLGVTELKVRDLPRVRSYYEDAIGLQLLDESSEQVTLGNSGEPLVRLIRSDDPLPAQTEAGLYHTAILYKDKPTLAKTLLSMSQHAPESFQGAADHSVSLAFYFGDPEGNGVELYVDRPREEWEWKDGEVTMGRDPIDVNQFIQENVNRPATDSALVGHMHLKVGNLDEARSFYADTLGFDVTAKRDGALFYSAGGYHHHFATNTWMSAGSGPRTSEVGLGSLTIRVPAASDVEEVSSRLANAGVEVTPFDGGIAFQDPWNNKLRVVER